MDPNFVEFCREKLQKNSILGPNGVCMLWQGCLKKCGTSKYGVFKSQIPPETKSKQLYVHRLAYVLGHGLSMSDIDQKNMHVSHLCHNSACMNPAHLSYEPDYVNIYRRTCVSLGVCRGHGDLYDDCMLHCRIVD